jgi:hypothetical protein
MINYQGHILNFFFEDHSCDKLTYYKCNACDTIFYHGKYDPEDEYFISIDYNKNNLHLEKLLTCEEYIIKNIIE